MFRGVVLSKATITATFGKQLTKVWAGTLCGPQIAKQSEKAESRQMELAPI